MRLALAANDAIGWDRNRGIPESKRLPQGRILRKGDVDAWLGNGSQGSISGAALWYDGLALNTERLLLGLLKEAHARGACLANYLEAGEIRISAKRACGVEAVDRISGGSITIRSAAVVNAAGPWIESVLPAPAARVPSPIGWTLALNLITPRRLTGPTALGLEGPGGESRRRSGKRFFFFVPWRGYTMIGTRYWRHEGRPGETAVTRREIEAFIDELNSVHPAARLKWEDISFYHAGLLPAAETGADSGEDPQPDKEFQVIDHGRCGQVEGLLTVKSVKYTTAPDVARQVLMHLSFQGRPAAGGGPDRRGRGNLEAAFPADEDPPDAQRHPERSAVAAHLAAHYGPEYRNVLAYLGGRDAGEALVSQDPPVLAAEIFYAVRHEMAFRLADVVLRRTGMGTAACPPRPVLEAAAALMAGELGWDDDRRRHEISDLLKRYAVLADPAAAESRRREGALAS